MYFAKSCKYLSTQVKYCKVLSLHRDLMEKNREDMVRGPAFVFTRKVVVDETFIRDSTKLRKIFVGIDTSNFILSLCVK